MNRGTAKRTKDFPYGDVRVPSVANANTMVSRVVLLLYLVLALGGSFVLEQPINSMLECHPRFVEFFLQHKVWRHSVRMEEHAETKL